MRYYKNVEGKAIEFDSEQIRLDDYLVKPQKEIGQIKSNPLLSEISPPPLGIDPDKIPPRKYPPLGIDPDKIPPRKYPPLGLIPIGSEEGMIKAKEEFLKTCGGGLGSSVIAEPDLGTPTNPILGDAPIGNITPSPIGGLVPSPIGGANGGSADKTLDTTLVKKPFPYWILIAGLVGGYLIFRKK